MSIPIIKGSSDSLSWILDSEVHDFVFQRQTFFQIPDSASKISGFRIRITLPGTKSVVIVRWAVYKARVWHVPCIPPESPVAIVSFAVVIRVVTQRWGGALRDDPNNGCEGDYSVECALCGNKKSQLWNVIPQCNKPSHVQIVLYSLHSGVDSFEPLVTGRLKAPF